MKIQATVLNLYLIRVLGLSGSKLVFRPQTHRSKNFLTFYNFIGFISWFLKKWGLVYEYWSQGSGLMVVDIHLLGASHPNEVPSPQAPRSINFLRFHIFTGFSSWFWRKWGLVCENWSQGSGLADGYVFWAQVGMSSHFFKLIFKTSQYHQMKAAEWQVFRMASFSSLTFTVLETRAFKVQKTRHFLRKISRLWNFKKWGQNLWVFKIGF